MNQVFAIRSNKDVTALINGSSFYKTEATKDEAQTLYEQVKTVALNPKDNLVKELIEKFDPVSRVYNSQDLVRDSLGNWYLKGFSEPLPTKLLTKMKQFLDEGHPITPLVNF